MDFFSLFFHVEFMYDCLIDMDKVAMLALKGLEGSYLAPLPLG